MEKEKLSLKSVDTASCYVAIKEILAEKLDFDLVWDLDDQLIALEVHHKRYVEEYNKLLDKFYEKAEEGASVRAIKKDVKFEDFVSESEKLNDRKVSVELKPIDASKFQGMKVRDFVLKTLKESGLIKRVEVQEEKKKSK